MGICRWERFRFLRCSGILDTVQEQGRQANQPAGSTSEIIKRDYSKQEQQVRLACPAKDFFGAILELLRPSLISWENMGDTIKTSRGKHHQPRWPWHCRTAVPPSPQETLPPTLPPMVQPPRNLRCFVAFNIAASWVYLWSFTLKWDPGRLWGGSP